MDLNKVIKNAKTSEIQDIGASEQSAENVEIQLVSFMLDDVEYGVDILQVHEILRYPEITRLPNTPKFIKGVINLRGNVIPVVDVRIRFGFPKGKITDLTRIIVVETSGKQVGLLVDNVYQVVRIPLANVDPPSELITGVSEDFITGIGRFQDRLIVILNMSLSILLEDSEVAKTIN
ncbi:MAG TPA: chemotaxis protein CheW [Spirochaetota bacterium]|jgi:purine-binding chemotaxis protein CheW|nr:purine-binding chemotaxis protein CheW [Spirochaetota bacterium]OQA96904.1 MAG: Chemotaxis protein CheW [Spirochaetes bacterium ADurb.Bin218]HOK01963.1 chemotaxis protein CheW [Spirochaetota bacterium]HOK91639.1 chemotaxis protein CheW [Spirochaetota bacterium]HON15981.1 chemotaxis protein CheW [Spirochaetota bacterium]